MLKDFADSILKSTHSRDQHKTIIRIVVQLSKNKKPPYFSPLEVILKENYNYSWLYNFLTLTSTGN